MIRNLTATRSTAERCSSGRTLRLAAAGFIAMEEGPGRLHEDHTNARRLAEGVAEIMPDTVDLAAVATNIVFVDVSRTGWSALEWATAPAAHGLLVMIIGERIWMLTHIDVILALLGNRSPRALWTVGRQARRQSQMKCLAGLVT